MISCPPPAGATMCYRLDPYSLEVVTANKPKSMHDVVEPTILFYHRKGGKTGGAASPQQPQSATSKKKTSKFSPKNQELAVTPSPVPAKKRVSSSLSGASSPSGSGATPAVRYITLTTLTSASPLTLIAPFRVAAGDAVVFQAPNGGEHFGVVAHVHDADYCPPGSPTSVTKRLIRKARSVDQETQCANTQSTQNVRSVIDAVLQQQRPGGFGPGSLSTLEWQLDKSLLYVQMHYQQQQSHQIGVSDLDQDVHVLYKTLVAALGCEIQVLPSSSSTSSCYSPSQHSSSPALSDCGASSVGEAPSSCDF